MGDADYRRIFTSKLKYYMQLHGKNQMDLMHDLNLSSSTVSSWCTGQKLPRMGKIQMLADYFGINKSDLIEETNDIPAASNIAPMPELVQVPRLGRIACGTPIEAVENFEGVDIVPNYVGADFTLVCQGDSMINARIYDGDIVCIHKQETVENGEIAAVLVDGDTATLKRVRLFPDHLVLEPENPTYRPLVFWEEEMNNVRILGKATHFISTVK